MIDREWIVKEAGFLYNIEGVYQVG
jgi:hypothetical protein